MKIRSLTYFVLAVAVSLVGAGYRFYDSAHSIGLIHAKGGKVRHPAILDGGRSFYTMIATATVLPPYQGDARVVLEGNPPMTCSIYNSGPLIDLGVHRQPEFRDNTFYGLHPQDRLALWVAMRPAPPNPGEIAGQGLQANSDAISNGKASRQGLDENLALAFYDTKSNLPILRIPIIFRKNGVLNHERQDH